MRHHLDVPVGETAVLFPRGGEKGLDIHFGRAGQQLHAALGHGLGDPVLPAGFGGPLLEALETFG
ncbi:MAG TPA: hypothetical protein VGR16_10860 [Thermomicrobiales bacterium]|nr:hypothetical protein [Thermomicrobiales bacterium]